MKTIQEKYNAVLEGKFPKSQFVKDAKRELSQFLSPYNGFNDSVDILKGKGILTEAKHEEKTLEYDSPVSKYSDETLRRGIDYELDMAGIDSAGTVSMEDREKAEAKAIKNLEKDEMHYLNLLAGESNKVDKHDKMVDVKKGNEVDTFNGMKKAELKEEVSDENFVKAMEVIKQTLSKEGGASGLEPLVDALKGLGFKKDDVVDMLKKMVKVKKHRDGDYILLPLEEQMYIDDDEFNDEIIKNEIPYVKAALKKDDNPYADDEEMMYDFVKTHKEDFPSRYSPNYDEFVAREFDEFFGANFEYGPKLDEKTAKTVDDVVDPHDYVEIGQGYLKGFKRPHSLKDADLETLGRRIVKVLARGDIEKAKAKFVKEQMSDKEMEDIKKYGQEEKETKVYQLGDMWSKDFDYDGMLRTGLRIRISTPVSKMQQLFDSFTDVNYHTEAGDLGNAIESIEDGDKAGALKFLKMFRNAVRKTLSDISEGHCNTQRKKNEDIDEGLLGRALASVNAKLSGAIAGIGTTFKNIGRAVKGKQALNIEPKVAAGLAKLSSISKGFEKSAKDVQKVMADLFPKEDTAKLPEQVRAALETYYTVVKNAADGATQMANVKAVPSSAQDAKGEPAPAVAEGEEVNESRGAFDMCVSAIQDIAADGDISEREAAMEMMIAISDKYDFDIAGLESQLFHGDDSINEGRRAKSKGGKVVTEMDYDTGGYVEAMGPMFERACKMLMMAWEEWKNGPMTEPGMIEHAKRDVINFLDNKLEEDILQEKKGKDHDGDGDIDSDDYMAAKDKAIKKAMGKEKVVKENIKSIIKKVLEEGVINEAATNALAVFSETYGSYEGMKQAIIALQDLVTDIESYYDKTRTKIQKVYDTIGDIRNEEGLKVGGFLAPAIEQAFNKDLRPAIRNGFTKGLDQPKVKVVSPRDIATMQQPDELEEKQTVYSRPAVNGTLQETKKKK